MPARAADAAGVTARDPEVQASGAGRAWLLVLVAAVASRLALLFVGHLWTVSQAQVGDGDAVGFSDALHGLYRGDVGWYEQIRESGYERRSFTTTSQANWAFAPAWPMLWRLIDFVGPAALGALIVNVLLFAGACALLFEVLRGPIGPRAAGLACALLIALPGAQFTMRPGPESLFLFMSLLAVWLAQRPWPEPVVWLLVVLPVTVAAMARLQGLLVLLPVLWLLVQRRRAARSDSGLVWALRTGAGLLPIVAVPGALLLVFFLHLKNLTGNFFAAFAIQRAWDNDFALPGAAFVEGVGNFLGDGVVFDYYGYNLLPFSMLLLILATLLIALGLRGRTLPPALLGYAVASLAVVLTRDTTQAANRFLLVVFPLFGIAGALLVRRPAWVVPTIWLLLLMQVVSYLASLRGVPWAVT